MHAADTGDALGAAQLALKAGEWASARRQFEAALEQPRRPKPCAGWAMPCGGCRRRSRRSSTANAPTRLLAVGRTPSRPRMRELFVPAAQARVIDTWESTGLRGTASHDYEVQDVFVPEHRTFWFQEPPSDGGPLYRMPPVAMFATFIEAVQLGIARHAIEAFVELAMAKVPTMTQIVLADRPTAQTTLGKAKAMHAAAHAYLEATLLALWERVHGDRRALHSGRRQCRVRSQPARPLSARCANAAASRVQAGGQFRDRRTRRDGPRRNGQRVSARLPW